VEEILASEVVDGGVRELYLVEEGVGFGEQLADGLYGDTGHFPTGLLVQFRFGMGLRIFGERPVSLTKEDEVGEMLAEPFAGESGWVVLVFQACEDGLEVLIDGGVGGEAEVEPFRGHEAVAGRW